MNSFANNYYIKIRKTLNNYFIITLFIHNSVQLLYWTLVKDIVYIQCPFLP